MEVQMVLIRAKPPFQSLSFKK